MTQDQGSIYDLVRPHALLVTYIDSWASDTKVQRPCNKYDERRDTDPKKDPSVGYDSFSESVSEAIDFDVSSRSQSTRKNITEITSSIPGSPALFDSKLLVFESKISTQHLNTINSD